MLFTSIRTTIYVSLYSFILMFYFLHTLSQKGTLKISFAVDSDWVFFLRVSPF
ncbi:hypothetical protein LEP1GSC060_0194 [Leptospira weilii serovar Ranarum str. ICFT]|uniref:Uncharacterized protein n=1 Tax=Leptospira weilii serovar Ranarum str. ICFT TaxID=1218598 RepID=N1WLB0_9LEPT|nr:hypothetical protein LEP1GSC060_0194 [Leptospira weilii serovar Ranarum str. ICFT]